ncbi:MASE1 domain-containing protein [Edwardsiella piscicida]|nr:MASE1 domain-containing protein [Edwardsiella piscicida]WLJ44650.1 MASE1 domain-containing protein [Edwardsiella piscicida]
MSRRARYRVISLFILLAWGSGWLMLWTLGFYLTHSGQQAALFLPHGVYLALLILLSRRYWPALVLPPCWRCTGCAASSCSTAIFCLSCR